MAITQADIDQMLGNVPAWATEATLEAISSHKRADNVKIKKAFKDLTGLEFKFDEVKSKIDKANQSFEFDGAKKLAKGVQSTTDKLFGMSARDVDPLKGTADIMKMVASAVDGVVGVATKFTNKIPFIGTVATGLLKGIAGVGVVAAGTAAIYATILMEQEKSLRTIIDYGMVVDDLSQFTTMRDSVAAVGMSMQEMAKMLHGNKAMLANLPGDLVSATTDFIKFAGTMEESKAFGSFGYNVEQQTVRLLEETKLMYMSGQLEQFGQLQKDKIRKNFESSSTMTTFLANKFGDQRSSLLALRSEALTNVDFMSAIARNGEYLAEQYGENAVANVKASGASMKMLFTKVLGPEFGAQSEQVFNRFIKDIQIDASVLNDMPTSMIDQLNSMGPEVMANFKNIMEKAGTGQLTENQTVMAVHKLTKSIANAEPRFGDDPIVQGANALIANARVAPEAFLDMTEDTLTAGLDSVKELTKNASGTIESIDRSRIAFRTIITTMEPGYTKSKTAVDFFAGSLELVEDTLRLVGMIPEEKPIPKKLPNSPLTTEEIAGIKGNIENNGESADDTVVSDSQSVDAAARVAASVEAAPVEAAPVEAAPVEATPDKTEDNADIVLPSVVVQQEQTESVVSQNDVAVVDKSPPVQDQSDIITSNTHAIIPQSSTESVPDIKINTPKIANVQSGNNSSNTQAIIPQSSTESVSDNKTKTPIISKVQSGNNSSKPQAIIPQSSTESVSDINIPTISVQSVNNSSQSQSSIESQGDNTSTTALSQSVITSSKSQEIASTSKKSVGKIRPHVQGPMFDNSIQTQSIAPSSTESTESTESVGDNNSQSSVISPTNKSESNIGEPIAQSQGYKPDEIQLSPKSSQSSAITPSPSNKSDRNISSPIDQVQSGTTRSSYSLEIPASSSNKGVGIIDIPEQAVTELSQSPVITSSSSIKSDKDIETSAAAVAVKVKSLYNYSQPSDMVKPTSKKSVGKIRPPSASTVSSKVGSSGGNNQPSSPSTGVVNAKSSSGNSQPSVNVLPSKKSVGKIRPPSPSTGVGKSGNNQLAPKSSKSPVIASSTSSRTPVTTTPTDKPVNTKTSVHLAIMSLLDNKIMNYMKDITEETEKAALTENIHGE
jgi:hypothetical protein